MGWFISFDHASLHQIIRPLEDIDPAVCTKMHQVGIWILSIKALDLFKHTSELAPESSTVTNVKSIT